MELSYSSPFSNASSLSRPKHLRKNVTNNNNHRHVDPSCHWADFSCPPPPRDIPLPSFLAPSTTTTTIERTKSLPLSSEKTFSPPTSFPPPSFPPSPVVASSQSPSCGSSSSFNSAASLSSVMMRFSARSMLRKAKPAVPQYSRRSFCPESPSSAVSEPGSDEDSSSSH